ncbi:RDD family protein [Ruficoccus sp. ZRK36]|uniref:RDD family protein n=1 Tax=Ruficoccus sp. ZRK36 TaxID=2866311 RepID=UPI001C73C03B|nr:RDD family protein [Ruficoccus sp. ZRK36]QYY35094.1 RDD family protein [Ruficoccus sp. ZRK36]
MDWYYLEDNEEVGPFSSPDFQELFNSGRINGATAVRNSEMQMAMPLDQAARNGLTDDLTLEGSVNCPTCNASVRSQDLIPMDDIVLCPNCRDQYLQTMREGIELSETGFEYASFLIRAGAYIIDLFAVWIVQAVVGFVLGFAIGIAGESEALANALSIVLIVLSYAIPLVYATLLLGNRKTQATLGMMALRIRIVDKRGGDCSYLMAFGRYFAAIISSIILGIGYFMCLWDSERQTLHDKMVGTYVIKK